MDTVEIDLDEIDKKLEEATKRMERYWVHEFFPHICPYCKNMLSSKTSLRKHIATSKKCKQRREENNR